MLAYLEERAGSEFDPDYIRSFLAMMRQWDQRVAVLESAEATIPETVASSGTNP